MKTKLYKLSVGSEENKSCPGFFFHELWQEGCKVGCCSKIWLRVRVCPTEISSKLYVKMVASNTSG